MERDNAAVRVVMVSSTARDLPKHRDQVMSACLQQNLFPKMMEYLPASDANAIRASLSMVDEADLYVGIIAFRYGYVPKGHKVSITEMEYDRAGKRGIPRLMFLMDEEHPLRAADVETGPGAERIQAFRRRIGRERVIATFSSPDDLRARVVQALSEFRAAPERQELVNSQVAPIKYRVAVLNLSEKTPEAEIEAVVAALQTQVHRDLATTWGIDAELKLFRTGEKPPREAWWLKLQDETNVEGVVGHHDVTAAGLPLAYIGIETSKQAGVAWSVAASHTLLQLLANPKGNVTVFEAGRFIPQEICRPCTGDRWAYQINGIKVADFVLPAWFEGYRRRRSTRFDFAGHISEPYQILQGGYLFYFDKASPRQVFASEKAIKVLGKTRRRK
jgi:hypothetical protein